MKSREAILLSKMGKKKVPTVNTDTYSLEDVEKMEAKMADGTIPLETAKTGGSLDVLKSYKAGSTAKLPTAKLMGELPVEKAHEVGSNPVLKSKKVPYSPIKSYLKGK